jgi:hypothetical protein
MPFILMTGGVSFFQFYKTTISFVQISVNTDEDEAHQKMGLWGDTRGQNSWTLSSFYAIILHMN